MSTEKLSPQEKRSKIKELILSKQYGYTLTYEELNDILQLNLKDYYEREVFRRQMNKVKNELFCEGYVIRPILNVGYYILKPNQVSSYTYRNYIVKPLKSLKKAKVILDNTNKNQLNGQEITEHNTSVELTNSLIYANESLLNDDEYRILKK